MRISEIVSLRGRRKKGRGEGEKHKRGDREGSACYKSRCHCNPPTIFWTNPIMSLSIRDQSQLRGFPEWSELNYFVYRKLSSWDAFFKWYHNRAKWNILLLLLPQQTRQTDYDQSLIFLPFPFLPNPPPFFPFSLSPTPFDACYAG